MKSNCELLKNARVYIVMGVCALIAVCVTLVAFDVQECWFYARYGYSEISDFVISVFVIFAVAAVILIVRGAKIIYIYNELALGDLMDAYKDEQKPKMQVYTIDKK